MATAAVAVEVESRDGTAHDRLRRLYVALHVGQDLLQRDVFLTLEPAVVVSDQRHGGVAELGLAGELGLLKVGHADDVEAELAVRIGFGACREPVSYTHLRAHETDSY